MNALEQHLLRAYLDGDLDADATAAFEILMLERPDLAAAVDADTALRIGLGGGGLQRDTGAAPARSATILPFRARLWPTSMAASLLLALGFSGAWFTRPAQDPMQGLHMAYVDKTRSISATPVIELPRKEALVLQVPVASADPCQAEFEIAQGPLSLRAHATPDEYGYASVLVRQGALSEGAAEVVVRCAGHELARYPVQFAPAAAAPGVP
jgi:hypothetical protein